MQHERQPLFLPSLPSLGAPLLARQRFFDKPQNVKRVLRALYTVCALVFLSDIVDVVLRLSAAHELRHAERPWEGLPGFYSAYGFLACVALVLIAKQLRKILMRAEDFYDR